MMGIIPLLGLNQDQFSAEGKLITRSLMNLGGQVAGGDGCERVDGAQGPAVG